MAGQQTWSSTVHMHTPAVCSKYSLVPFPASSAAGHCRLEVERGRRRRKNSSGFCPVPAASLSRQTFVPRHRQCVAVPRGTTFFYSELHHSRFCSQSALLVTGRGGNIRPGCLQSTAFLGYRTASSCRKSALSLPVVPTVVTSSEPSIIKPDFPIPKLA